MIFYSRCLVISSHWQQNSWISKNRSMCPLQNLVSNKYFLSSSTVCWQLRWAFASHRQGSQGVLNGSQHLLVLVFFSEISWQQKKYLIMSTLSYKYSIVAICNFWTITITLISNVMLKIICLMICCVLLVIQYALTDFPLALALRIMIFIWKTKWTRWDWSSGGWGIK